MLEFSIIVPAFNAEKTLPKCLVALKNQTIALQNYEIIVVDDGSTDETARLAETAGVRVIRQANAGAAAARNIGARAAQSDILLFTDADCVPAFDWSAQMLSVFDDEFVTGAKGIYKTESTGLTPRFVQQEYQDKYDRMAGLLQIDFVDTYSAAYRRTVFLAAGGFDTRYPGASVEDQEFSFRLAEMGHRLVFAPKAIVSHPHDASVFEYARRKFFIGFWKIQVVSRHPDKITRDSHTPQVLKLQMGFAALSNLFLALAIIFRRRWLGIASLVSWLALVVSGAPFYRKIWRRDVALIGIAPFMLMVRALALGFGFAWGLFRFVVWERLQW